MSGIEADIANESSGAILAGIVFFVIGLISRALVNKIEQALVVSAVIGSAITLFVMVLDMQNNSINNLLGYLALFAYSSVVTQIGNTVTGLTIRFLTWIKDEVL